MKISHRSSLSIGNQSPSPTYAREQKKDNRKISPAGNTESKTPIICPSCGASIFLKQYRMIGNHRVGGGRYSVMRGDALCLSSNTVLPK